MKKVGGRREESIENQGGYRPHFKLARPLWDIGQIDTPPPTQTVLRRLLPLSLTTTAIMGAILHMLSYLLFLVSLPLISALKFDMAAHHGHESAKYERCIRNFVAKDQLVVVTANVDGNRGDGQQLNLHVILGLFLRARVPQSVC